MNLIITGIIIGICISIPVGPIAVLCIQRTLNRGKYHGFVTGLGAACSDVFYSTLAVLGLSFVVDFLQAHELLIEIIGAVVIFVFGYYLFRSNPSRALKANEDKKESFFQDFISGLGLTVSNPLIVFLFIPLFAQFDFVSGDSSLRSIVVALSSVLLGAALWWFLLNSIVNIFRSKINVRGLGLINKISGGILAGIAIVGLIAAIVSAI